MRSRYGVNTAPTLDNQPTPEEVFNLPTLEELLAEARFLGHKIPNAPQMYTRLELMYPERAQRILSTMTSNRRLSRVHVESIKRDIDNGRFFPTNQGIGISPEGILVDGQHRLVAIIQSGKAIHINVTYGVTHEAVKAIDENRKRTHGDDLYMDGVDNAYTRSAITRVVAGAEWLWERDLALSSLSNVKFNRHELDDWYAIVESTVDVRENLIKASSLYRTGDALGIPKSAAGAFHYLACKYHSASFVEDFIRRVGQGVEIMPNSPEQALRKRVSKIREDTRKGYHPAPPPMVWLAYMIVAYNKAVAGESAVRIDLPKHGRLTQIAGYHH